MKIEIAVMLTMAGVGAQRKTQYKSFNGFKTTNSEFEGVDLFCFESWRRKTAV